MRPQSQIYRSTQSFPIRLRRPTYRPRQCLHTTSSKYITADEKPLPQSDGEGPGPNQSQLPHVSEEAAAIGKVTGEGGPEIEEQGTPVQEVGSMAANNICRSCSSADP